MYNPFSLIGKTIFITGASSGIGRATAIECSKMGAKLVLTARNEDRLKETMSQLEGDGHQYFIADLSSEEDIKQMVDQLPIVDGLVLCAGMSMLKPILALNSQDIESVFATNCFAPMLLTKYIIKAKKANKAASLVYIGSISGNGNIATALSTYGTSKSALVSFVQYAALELAGKQIRCNAILPGRVCTSLLQNQTMSEEDIQKDLDKYPLHRYGEPQEVALSCVYLLSDATRWMTGSCLTIDGGRTLV